MNWNQLYLVKVFKQSKWLFAGILIFIFFQIFFNVKRIHSFPWFVWDMYSRPEQVSEVNSCYEIYADGQRISYTDLPFWGEIGVYKTFRSYNWMVKNDYHDPMDEAVKNKCRYLPAFVYPYLSYKINNQGFETATYPAWLHQYLEHQLNKKIALLEIKEVKYKSENGKYIPNGESYILLRYPETK
jgi:hypothetical protein